MLRQDYLSININKIIYNYEKKKKYHNMHYKGIKQKKITRYKRMMFIFCRKYYNWVRKI